MQGPSIPCHYRSLLRKRQVEVSSLVFRVSGLGIYNHQGWPQVSFLFENPPADIGDVQSRRAVLKRHQPPQFVNIEVRVSLLTERNADEGRRRKSSDQDVAVGDHFFSAPSREHHGSRRVCPDFPGGALDIFDRVKLEDKLPPPCDLHSPSYEGLTVLPLEYLSQRRR